MFVICGRESDGRVRVYDTDDNTVEVVTPEQVKVVQIKGYNILTDFRYDYIYKLYEGVRSRDSINGSLSEHVINMRDVGLIYVPRNLGNYRYYALSINLYALSAFIFIERKYSSEIVLYTIKRSGDLYTIKFNKDIRRHIEGSNIEIQDLDVIDDNTISVNYMVDGRVKRLFVNYSCEVV